ncbi:MULTISPECIES: DUF3081 domain-containing protein [unclassified Pseudoalteromonas]|uniref:DUF3081 domain-containing protein n=1 Tax=unclassified Pseudoalteromonas TaxID=194690 RepID=UPI0020979562|nr:DUF3081 domain-containing protein [Pseudoalteromonas sp. XMcav2-N]MCO7190543.1 DUF3081 domain-containing protein [Pseudoalteromonas sp. XMcav2-N]
MKNEIDSRQILAVYEYIQQHGEADENGKLFEGIRAYSDPDGYTIYLEGSALLLRFGFHNTYHMDYQHEKNKEDFINKLNFIYQMANEAKD